MDINTVEKAKKSNGDVYLYNGDVNLESYQYTIYENPYTQVTLYHYTDAAKIEGIKKQEVIKGSTKKTPEKNSRHRYGKSLVCLLLCVIYDFKC